APQHADGSPQKQQRRSDDDGRDRHGKVDDDAEDALATETVARQHVGGVGAEDRIDRGRGEGDQEAEAERELRFRRGQGVPERLRAAFERKHEHRRERHENQRQQKDEDDRHRYGGASSSTDDADGGGVQFVGAIFITRRFQTSSTISFFALRHPPKSAIVKGSWIWPNSGWPALSSSCTLRKPYLTKIFWASSLQRNC